MNKKPLLFLIFLMALLNGSIGVSAQNKTNPSAYLFTYFTGNSGLEESIRFAISMDGYNYHALNDNMPVLKSSNISSSGGVRDPHILRAEDGKTFYMVATDMVSAKGWDSNRAMVLMKSNDLINWTSSNVNIQDKFPGNEDLLRVWAPQTIYDKSAGKYMIYWSMKHGKDPDKIYYAYANKDFTGLETTPKQLFFSPDNGAAIDGDIIYHKGKYHLFFKSEGNGAGIGVAVSDKLTGGYVFDGKYVQQTSDPVEGAGVFKLNNGAGYILMYDVYTKGKYQFTETKDFKNFKVVDNAVSMDFHPRHGTVLPITTAEAERLMKKWHNPVSKPDSVYLFSYGTNGLRFAWSLDKKNWNSVGNGFAYVKCDYSTWGSQKKMISPYLIRGRKGRWECVWQLNAVTLQFAHAGSDDLINWGPQAYPYFKSGKNILRPTIQYKPASDTYTIVYTDADGKFFQTATKDFKSYSPAIPVSAAAYKNKGISIDLDGKTEGQLHRVSWDVVAALTKTYELTQFKNRQNGELARDDSKRFPNLKSPEVAITLQPKKARAISNMLTGVFFEDLNYAADGGLYAEMIQNRDFEYLPADKGFKDKDWNSTSAWTLKGAQSSLTIDSLAPVHKNNPHYAVLESKNPGAVLFNSGYDGIAVKSGKGYDFSFFVKQIKAASGQIEVRLFSKTEGLLSSVKMDVPSGKWEQVKARLLPSKDATDVRLELKPLSAGTFGLDMVSLFPEDTFKNRPNGLRADLAQTIANIKPRFVRFPGGCLAHGDGLQNIYNWKNSIGPLESRKPDRNLWAYHQTKGLGYFEYFQFCEDIGAEPVPVVAAAVSCQNSATGGGGQQGGIPMSEMAAYIQDIIDLVEYANGGLNTTWGKKRAEAGHPAPFNLKYIGIGNEDQITEVFKERFSMIYKAMRKAHPEITVIGTAGPFFEGTDYVEGWKIASDLNVPMIDEHYYQPPGWFIHNQDFYDSYDRSKSKVYLGEYAAHFPGGKRTNWETSLTEALYLTSIERNGDVVRMASYAPLLAREGHTQWNPDLIYFNNEEVKPTIGYYVQQLYGQNAGNLYIPASIKLSNNEEGVRKRIAYAVVKDDQSNDLIIKLVNLLPVEVKSTINLNGIVPSGSKLIKTVISGKPEATDLRPEVSEEKISATENLELPAYSFTVLRFKTG